MGTMNNAQNTVNANRPAVVRDVYFVDFPANPAYAFMISAAPVVQYTAPIGPAPKPATTFIVRVSPIERNVAAALVRVKAADHAQAEAKARYYIENRANNHITRLAASRYLSIDSLRYHAVTEDPNA